MHLKDYGRNKRQRIIKETEKETSRWQEKSQVCGWQLTRCQPSLYPPLGTPISHTPQMKILQGRSTIQMSILNSHSLKIIFTYVYVYVSVREYAVCADAQRGQWRAAEPLELELKVVVCCLKRLLGSELAPSGRAASPLNHHLSSPVCSFIS